MACGVACPVIALAQPGDHVRLGEAELVPELVVGSHFRTNAYLQEADERSAFALLLQPSAELELDGRDLKLNLGAGYKARKYLGADLSNLDRWRDGNFDLGLRVLPHSMLGFNLDENLSSTSRESEAWYSESALISHLKNDVAGQLAFHPGGALEVLAGGHFTFEDYDVPPDTNIEMNADYNSRLAYGPGGRFKWRFFPRTALLLESSMDWFKWNNNLVNIQPEAGQTTTEFGSYLGIPDGTLFKVGGGLRGRFTERIAIGLVAGYNNAVYDENTVVEDAANEPNASEYGDDNPATQGFDADADGLDKLMASVHLEYDFSETHKAVLGYDRALHDSYFTNFVLHNYVFLRYNILLGTRLGLAAEGGYRLESFRGEVARADHVLRARGDLTYAASEWLAVGGGLWWSRRASSEGIAAIEYDDINVHLQATFTY